MEREARGESRVRLNGTIKFTVVVLSQTHLPNRYALTRLTRLGTWHLALGRWNASKGHLTFATPPPLAALHSCGLAQLHTA